MKKNQRQIKDQQNSSQRYIQLSPEVLPIIRKLSGPIDRFVAIDEIAKQLNLPESSVAAMLDQLAKAHVLLEDNKEYKHQTAFYSSGYCDLLNHRGMLQDQVRTSLFQQAIKELVSSKHTVIDVGAGSGILSFFSATAGAKKVHAIECTQIIKEAEVIAIRNNLHEKIDFFHGDANAFRMRSKADIIISEWIGYFVMEEYMYQAFQVVRDRYLRQGGKVIPSKVRMYLAPVEDADLYQFSGLGFWESPVYGYDFSFGKKRQLASPRSVLANITSAACIAEPWKILTVDCLKDKASIFHFEQSGEVNVERNANLHGFVGFFELDLSPSVILSTSPFSLRTHWQQVYFPIEQCYVQKDDRIRMTMITRPGKIGPSIQLKVSIFRGRKKIHQCEYCYNQSK